MNLQGLDNIIHGKSIVLAPIFAAAMGGASRTLAAIGEQTPAGIALWVMACGASGAVFAGAAKLASTWFTAKHNQRALIDTETKDLIERLHNDYRAMIKEAQFQKNQQKRIAALERRAKHNVLNAYGALGMYANDLVHELERLGAKPEEPCRVVPYSELVGAEDEKIEKILAEHDENEAE